MPGKFPSRLRTRRNRTALYCAVAGMGVVALHAKGVTTYTYTGASGGSWSVPGNWSPSGPPGLGGIALFHPSASGDSTLNFDGVLSGTGLTNLNIDPYGNGEAIFSQTIASSIMIAQTEVIGDFGDGQLLGVYSQSAGLNTVNTSLTLGNGNGGNGLYNLSGGTVGGSYTLYLGSGTGSTGTFNLSSNGSLTATNVNVGYSGVGYFNQSGGTHTVATGWLYLGNQPGSVGNYALAGGTLNVLGGLEQVGYYGAGTFTQTGGVNNAGALAVGNFQSTGASGVYNLSNGATLNITNNMSVGDSGVGTVNQYSGANSINGTFGLLVGYRTGSSGTYNLSGGVLSVPNAVAYVGYQGTGTINQTGGTLNAGSAASPGLFLGFYTGSSGTYNLSGTTSVLNSPGGEGIGGAGTGVFTQTGGTNNSGNLTIGGSQAFLGPGTYNLNGGSLVAKNITVAAYGTFNQGTGTLQFDTFLQNGNATFSPAPLTVDQAVGQAATPAYTYANGGLGAYDGVYVGYNRTGTFTQTGGSYSFGENTDNLIIGYNVGSSGTYTLSAGGISFYQISGEYVGYSGAGAFFQTGGTQSFNFSDLILGVNSTGNGTYTLSGGVLNMAPYNNDVIGEAGSGTFNQTGGSHTLSQFNKLIIGDASGGVGVYNLSAGLLSVTNSGEFFGFNGGSGIFNQTGGTHTISTTSLYLGYAPGSSGTINLSAGSMTFSGTSNAEYLGYYTGATGVINQSGGTHTITAVGTYLAYSNGASGTYSLSNGATLTVNDNFNVGYAGNGIYNQTGGTASLGGQGIFVGYTNGASGTVNLSGGTFTVPGSAGAEFVGFSGTGVFNQSGGTNAIPNGGLGSINYGSLYLGYNAGSVGTYNLSGGMLAATGVVQIILEVVGNNGTGYFNQTGGTNNAAFIELGFGTGGIGTFSLSNGATLADSFFVGASGKGIYNQTGGTAVIDGTALFLGYNSGSSGTVNLSGGNFSTIGKFAHQYVGYNGTGVFNQSGGTNTVGTAGLWIGYQPSISGTYNLSGTGMLTVTNSTLAVGFFGQGVFNQSGGTATLNGSNFYVGYRTGSTGLYSLSAGSLSLAGTSTAYIGFQSSGVFNQTGGTSTINGSTVYLGYGSATTGLYNLSVGTLSVTNTTEYVGYQGNGAFTQTSGLHSLSGTASSYLELGENGLGNGTYTLSGGTLSLVNSFENVGDYTTGTFIQNGGTQTVSFGGITISKNSTASGKYLLSGGMLSLTNGSFLSVGSLATGTFSQSGGTVTISSGGLYLAENNQGIGNYSLTNGTLALNNSAEELIGYFGNGTFNQSGGTHTITNGYLYVGVYGTGSYTLSNGSLALTNSPEYVGYGANGSFNQSGGTHSISGGNLYIGNTSPGMYTLSGGTLSATNVQVSLLGTIFVSGGAFSTLSTVNNGFFGQSGGTSTLGVVSGTGSISLNSSVSAASMSVTSFAQRSLTINGGILTVAVTTPHVTNTLNGLTINAGELDVGNSQVIVSYPSGASPGSNIRNLIISGSNGGGWNGPGIVSTLITSHVGTSIGYVDGGDGVPTATNTLAGTVKFGYALQGDTGLRGTVDLQDYLQLASHFHETSAAKWSDGDFNYDGKVDLQDYLLLARNFHGSISPAAKSTAAIQSTTLSGAASPAVAVPVGLIDPGNGNLAIEVDPTNGHIYIVGNNVSVVAYNADSATGLLNIAAGKNPYQTLKINPSTIASWNVLQATPQHIAENVTTGTTAEPFAAFGSSSGDYYFDLTVPGSTLWTGTPAQVNTDLAFDWGDSNYVHHTGQVIDLVPEPATLSILGLTTMALMSRRRRPAPSPR